MTVKSFFGYCLVLLVATPPALIASPAATAPGSYHDWNREIDEVVILQPFHADNYREIVVEAFDSTGVKLPDSQDNTLAAVRSALESIRPAFVEGLQKKLHPRVGSVAVTSKRTTGINALAVRARLTKVDPGSQAARYWGGFGAGQ